jgi:hypothetical protein
MKKDLQAEDKGLSSHAFFEATDFGRVAAYGEFAVSPTQRSDSKDVVLDGILAAIKWMFLYIPGVAGIHMIMMGYVFILYSRNWSNEFLTIGALVPLIICMFMIMLGIGKLGDLRYLRVVVSIFTASAAAALLLAILIAFAPVNYFAIYSTVTLFATLLLGYLTKKDTDRGAAI